MVTWCVHTLETLALLLYILVFNGLINGKLQDPYPNFTLDAQPLDGQARLSVVSQRRKVHTYLGDNSSSKINIQVSKRYQLVSDDSKRTLDI